MSRPGLSKMRLGVLTGGGDCPGLNAVIWAVVCRAVTNYGDEVVGFVDGWRGVIDDEAVKLDVGLVQAKLSRAVRLMELGVPIIGVPKTIDNDIGVTDQTFGFDTVVSIAIEAIDRLHTTAESHHRVMVVEVMGRHRGHIPAWAGIAGGAVVTLIPEEPFDIVDVCRSLEARHGAGRYASIVVVAEGAKPAPGDFVVVGPEFDAFGHERLGGIGAQVAGEIEHRTGIETRVTVLGHIQRGGTPTAADRVLATRFGVAAVDAAHRQHWGQMVALRGTTIETVPLVEAVENAKPVDAEVWATARVFLAKPVIAATIPRPSGDERAMGDLTFVGEGLTQTTMSE